MKKKRIIICGTHFTPALSVIESLKEKTDVKVYYFGRKYPLEGDSALSLEYITLKNLRIPFFSLYGGRLQRSFSLHSIPSLFKLPVSLIQSAFFLIKIKPSLILSFGGYIALPVCLVGYLFGVPIITHEQTRKLGLANRIIAKFAKIVCLSWPDTQNIPEDVKIVLTGNPIRRSILQLAKNTSFNKKSDKPLIYITGGSLGSHSLNMVIGEALPMLVSYYRIIHQCGSGNNHKDYQYLMRKKMDLPKNIQHNYKIMESILPAEVGKVYQQTDLIIGRSGVNTVTEIMILGLPAILIPLPWAGGNEQENNAFMVEKLGLGQIIKQEDLSPRLLVVTINQMIRKLATYRNNLHASKQKIILNATDRIIKLIEEFTS